MTTDLAPKRRVCSFDIFDTLIARSVAEPTNVFDIVELAGVINFKALRLQAQALSNHTWADIYKHYQRLTGIGDAEVLRVQQLELEAEMSVSYLISDTYHRLRDGDILVSDMYLPPDSIKAILFSAGFRKNVDIHVSPFGKHAGNVWGELQKIYDIEHHIGDNIHGDVTTPARFGIASTHYTRSQAAPMELFLRSHGAAATADLLRRFRLTNPFEPYTREDLLHEAQALANLPFLLLMAVHLHQILQHEGLSRLLFMTNGSCLLQPLYELLFPDTESRTFHSCPIALQERRPGFVDYIRRIYEPSRTLIFDLCGAPESGHDLFLEVFGVLPRVHIFSGPEGRAPGFPDLSCDVLLGSNGLKALNLDWVGPLVTVGDDGLPIRAPAPVASVEVGRIYRAICARFVEDLRPRLEEVRYELLAIGHDVPWADIHQFLYDVAEDTPAVPRMAEADEHKSLTQIMNEARSDKGNAYACAHCYSYVYERLVQELTPRNHLALLEIGLNRDGENEIPSLHGWRAYLGAKATLYGADIKPSFLSHHDPAAGIHILVIDQSKRADLVRCGLANPMGYDLIIDDGSHISSHQQTTLAVLWQFLRPGGIYIIEDLHYQPCAEPIMGTRELLKSWLTHTPASTAYLQADAVTQILNEASSIEFYDSKSRLWGDAVRDALAVIRKRPG
jgi:hypothetical protein